MTRRTLLGAGLLSTMLPAADNPSNALFEMRYYYLRNTLDNQVRRTTDYLKDVLLPAVQRAGAGAVGAFRSNVGPESPYFLTVTSFPSLSSYEGALNKLKGDSDYQKGLTSFNSGPNPAYVRMESALLRAFDSIPQLEVPPTEGRQSPRLFELRTYESNNLTSLARKIRMFNEGEIGLFRKLDMRPVFFGETLIGRNQPNLTYMLAYDDMAMRERVWRNFVSSPEWKKMSGEPGVSDAEIVSNISNSFLSPLPFSAVR